MCLGVPGRILDVQEGDLRTGRVTFSGVVREVCLEYVPEAGVGDWVIVHVGFAITRLDEAEAERTSGPTSNRWASSRAAFMKYVDEYRDEALCRSSRTAIARTVDPALGRIMEVCGGQTHSIVRYGIDWMLPDGVELVHGPGCPVCVTSLEMIDRAHRHRLAARTSIFSSFGDMLRVPGSRGDLLRAEERGRGRPHRLLAARRARDRARKTRDSRSSSSASASRRPLPRTRWPCSRRDAGRRQLLDARLARARAARDRGDPRSPENRRRTASSPRAMSAP